jgi:glycosyltransferase involved in cell wall biosynthesis
VDLRRFHEAQPVPRVDFGFTDQDILLIYAGRIAPEKNLEFLIRSFAGVSQVFSNVHLLIVGSGQKQFEEEIRSLPSELDISGRVHFLGMIPNDRLPSYLAMCDAFVTASVTEVHPFSVIEAMATGLPIMGIDSPGVGDSVSDRESGLLATNDLASFTAKLTYLCSDSDLRKEMGRSARKASAEYDLQRTTKIMLGHYMRLCESTKPLKQSLDERLMAVLEEFLK